MVLKLDQVVASIIKSGYDANKFSLSERHLLKPEAALLVGPPGRHRAYQAGLKVHLP
jgi:hypothetical protein